VSPREAIQDLLVEYGLLIDEDRLEDWVELFAEPCSYRIVARENVEQNLPQVLMLCTNKDMLHDRVTAYRQVNEYNLHSDRHVIGMPRLHGERDGVWRAEASYSLFQTDVEGVSRLFSVGRYDITVVFENGRARLRDVLVIVDTAAIPTLLATPI
jgi:anthranilate 1,2-dioxygenase small subunit